MTGKGKRRRADTVVGSSDMFPPQSNRVYPNDPLAPATKQDKLTWKGYCEIESEPAFFNVMLKEFGVEDVKTLELFSLDDESLAELPKPVYGLVFLFRYREDESDAASVETCPEEVWFANQTSLNSCASVALLNIINNIPDAKLGDNLASFKEFTKEFSPALRGNAIDNYEFVKQIHNSFARKMDMLEADLIMKNNVEKENQKKKARKTNDDDYEGCYHFIAYVPVDGKVWSLDGLQRQPTCIGGYNLDHDWLKIARPFIQDRMAAYENGAIAFNLLALIRKPAASFREELDICNHALSVVEERLRDLLTKEATRVNKGSPPPSGSQEPLYTPALPEPEGQTRLENEGGDQDNKKVEPTDKMDGSLEPSTSPVHNQIAGNEIGGHTEVAENGVDQTGQGEHQSKHAGDFKRSPRYSPTSPKSPHPEVQSPKLHRSGIEVSPTCDSPYSPDEERPAKRQKSSESKDEEEPNDDPRIVQTPTRTKPERNLGDLIPTKPGSQVRECTDINVVRRWKYELERGIWDRKNLIKQEERSEEQDEEQAASRRWDYGPFIRKWLGLLVQKGVAKDLFEQFENDRKERERQQKQQEREAVKARKKKPTAKGKAEGRKRGRKS